MPRPIVHFCNTPSPYRNAEWDVAAEELGQDAVVIVFCDTHHRTACWQPDFPKLCPYYTLGGTAEQHGIELRDVPALLDRLNPGVVILSGYRSAIYRAARRWCLRRGVPYCLRSDGNVHWLDAPGRKGLKAFLRSIWLSNCVRQAKQCLVTGTTNRGYWQRFGMQPRQEGWFPQWIDYPLFSSARAMRKNQRDELRKEFGIRLPYTVFTAGRILDWKRVDLLCEAMLRLDDRLGLVVAGHGPVENEVRQQYQSRLGDRLMFVGNIEPRDLPRWYAATDIYGLASGAREAWGLVIVEAAAAGMPIVAHRLSGAVVDLVEDGVNGFLLDSTEPQDWADAFQRFLDDPSLISKLGAESCRHADQWRDRSRPGDCLSPLLEASAV